MNIRNKILIFIGATSLALMAAMILTSRIVVLGSFRKLEEQTVRRNVDQVLGKLANELRELNSVSYDYGVWDDTYQYIVDLNEAYVRKNVYPEMFLNNSLNLFLFIDHSGRLVDAQGFNLVTMQSEPAPENIMERISRYPALLHPPREGKTALLSVNGLPMLCASWQILPSNMKGTSRGVLMAIRYLNEALVKRFSQETRLNIRVHPMDGAPLSPGLEEIRASLSRGRRIVVIPLGMTDIAGYALLRDLREQPVSILEVNIKREIFQTGESTVRYFILWHFGLILAVGVLTVYALEKIVLFRLTRHSRELGRLGESGDLSTRLDVSGKDELSNLAVTINQMVQALERLQKRESKRRVRDLVENSLVGICIVRDGRVVYSNSELKRILGILPESIRFSDLNVYPGDAEKFRRTYEAIQSGGGLPIDIELRFLYFDDLSGEEITKWAHLRANAIKYQGARAILVNMVDITRFRELENIIMIREKMASLGNVAAGIAHEIRNPLSGINLILDAVIERLEDPGRDEADEEEAVDLLRQSKEAVRKMESVIRRVLDFSRPNTPRLVMTDINEPVREAIELSRTAMRKSDIILELDLAENLPEVRVDIQMFEQVILNLINNAADAMKDSESRKVISIASAQEGDNLLLTVSDSGPGVPGAVRAKIFDPFFTTKADGSGIGLSLSLRIIADHGGSIEAGAPNSGGAEFKIKIPIQQGGLSND
ncbi:MAG: HAMP domain-containing protein [Desulfobacterales bacterium]|nr:HAMP domain-containing protein [Desulfobacterales bacterium]